MSRKQDVSQEGEVEGSGIHGQLGVHRAFLSQSGLKDPVSKLNKRKVQMLKRGQEKPNTKIKLQQGVG